MSSLDDHAGSKWDRAARYIRIAQVLHAHGETGIGAADLAKQVGVSKRTIYRDLDAMDLDGGIPIWNENGRFGLEAGAFLPPLALTLPEAMSLFLASRLLSKATDELDPEIIGAWVKLAQIVPAVLGEQLHQSADAFADTPRQMTFTRVLRGLTQAIVDRRVVDLDYRADVYDPSKGTRHVRLHPYAIEPSAATRALYVIGFDEERGGRRTFKVERILAISLRPESFPAPDGSVAGEMLAAWDVISNEPQVEVVVRFAPAVAARAAETRWHAHQSTEPGSDGSLIWRTRVAGLLEIRSWLLGWGPDVEVLEPAELRDWVAAQHAAAAELYRD